MEVDDIQSHHQPCKMSRITSNSRNDSNKIGRKGSAADQYQQQQQDAEDEEAAGGGGGDQRKVVNINNAMINTAGGVGGFDLGSKDNGRLRAWQSSRIFRVSRASGGKDRHSKVLTAKGLRDRRVRLSVSTAIQFYDLQDRLGYDQPSKAVEWLIKAAADAITELPSLNATFPDVPKLLLSDDKRIHHNVNLEPRMDMTEIEFETDSAYNQHHHHHQQQQHNLWLSKSASSTSETSKGSVLSLSRSEIRVKARERARERTAKDKEKPDEAPHHSSSTGQQNSQSSFTELLTGAQHNNSSSLSAAQQNFGFSNFVLNKQHRPLAPTQMDYFTGGLFGGGTLRNNNHYSSSGFSTQTDYGNAPHATPHTMGVPPPPFTVTADHHNSHHHQNQQHPEMHQFSFLSDHLIPDTAAATAANGNEYNLKFSISSGIAGFNRGTLQSNSSQSQLPHHLQPRFSSSPSDGPNMPFFMGNVGNAAPSITPAGNQFPSGFDGRLQLCYGNGGGSHSDLKGKVKN